MKLSILDPVQIPSGQTSTEAIQGSIALAQIAENLGYHRYWLVEHHDVPYEVNPAPEVLAVALGYATKTIRIGVGGVLLNQYSPYKVAETLRTLNALFPDRIDVGIGRATAGIVADTALKRLRDIDLPDDHAQQTEELVGWLGNDLPEESPFHKIKIMPDQAAGPLPWVLAATEASAKRAALLGLPLACSAFHVPENAPGAMKAYFPISSHRLLLRVFRGEQHFWLSALSSEKVRRKQIGSQCRCGRASNYVAKTILCSIICQRRTKQSILRVDCLPLRIRLGPLMSWVRRNVSNPPSSE
ncbi:MsnO8 family LLM class oxidoreductase [Paraburkholderia aspalathi]|nr:MsnO8 family LLM class oxidoreductase [Paraburkholderia aspalathi]